MGKRVFTLGEQSSSPTLPPDQDSSVWFIQILPHPPLPSLPFQPSLQFPGWPLCISASPSSFSSQDPAAPAQLPSTEGWHIQLSPTFHLRDGLHAARPRGREGVSGSRWSRSGAVKALRPCSSSENSLPSATSLLISPVIISNPLYT